MNPLPTTYTHLPNETPEWPRFYTAIELSRITGIDASDLMKYAQDGVCPHVVVNTNSIQFLKSETLKWIKHNLVKVCRGVPLQPIPIGLILKRPRLSDLPDELQLAAGHFFEMPAAPIPAVYFLCNGNEIVYIGKSNDVYARVRAHKKFSYDRIFALPCPSTELEKVEASCIDLFEPEYNIQKRTPTYCGDSLGHILEQVSKKEAA